MKLSTPELRKAKRNIRKLFQYDGNPKYQTPHASRKVQEAEDTLQALNLMDGEGVFFVDIPEELHSLIEKYM